MSSTGWADPIDFEGALRDLSKRMARLERRPAAMSAGDLLGPGLASYAVGIIDWNATEATLNGFYYTFPGSLNSPDEALSWTGQTIAKDDGTGMQQVWNTDGAVPVYWVRTYAPNVVPGGPPVFDDWKRFATASGLIEGDMLDPDTFPGEMEPVDPPADSPVPVTTIGPSAVIVNYEWTRGETVDLYVSLVDGAPIDASTLHTVNFPQGGFVYTDATGQVLPVDTDVYVALVAKNAAGEAAASPWVVGQAGAIPPEFLHMLVGTLIAQRLIGEEITGVLITGSELQITGAITAYDNFLSIVAQTMTAYSAVFEDNLDLRGDNNVLRGTFTITSGVPDPKAPPEVSPHWPSVTTEMADDPDIGADDWYGLTQGIGAGYANQVGSAFNVFGGGGVRFHDLTTGVRNPFVFPNFLDFYPEGGVACDGTHFYVLGRDATIGANAWRVRKYDDDWTTLVDTFNPGLGTPVARPTIGARWALAGVQAGFIVVEPGIGLFGTNFGYTEYDASGTVLNSEDLIYDPGDIDLGGCAKYESSAGVFRVVVAPESGHDLLGFNPVDGSRVTSADRPRAQGNRVRGLYRDGTRFRSMNRAGTIYRYSIYGGGDPGAVYAYVDGDAGGLGVARSGPSPVGDAAVPRGAYIQVTTQAPPDNGGVDDPDRNYVYLGASDAATKFLHTDGELTPGDLIAVFDTVPTSGDEPEVTSEFAGRASTTNGRIASGALNDDDDPLIDLLGTGDWRIAGPNMMDSGDLVPTGSFTGRVHFFRIGNQVFYEGYIDRDDNFGTTPVVITGITIPDWALPVANITGPPHTGYGTANKYRYTFNTSGTMEVQREGVITTFMTFSGHYPAA